MVIFKLNTIILKYQRLNSILFLKFILEEKKNGGITQKFMSILIQYYDLLEFDILKLYEFTVKIN